MYIYKNIEQKNKNKVFVHACSANLFFPFETKN